MTASSTTNPPVTSFSPASIKTGKIHPIGEHAQVEILMDGPQFLGLGQVLIEGVSMRSGRLPILPELRSPNAIRFENFQAETARSLEGGGFELRLKMLQSDDGPMEWMVHTVRQRYRTSDWGQSPRPAENTSLRLEMRPVEKTVEGETGRGFSYQYHYASADIALYKILDRATWEPGGDIQDNAFWLRNAFSPSIQHFKSAADHYCTEWYLRAAQNPNVFEFLPFQSGLCGFTFTANEKGTLVTWVPQVSHVRSFFEKERNASELKHFHELCGDLSLDFSAAPIEVLWFAGKRNHVELLNLYEKVRSLVSKTLHAEIGMRVERATSYGIIEEWQNADLKRYRENGLSQLTAAGVRTVFLANHFENNMNTFGVSNMCCTVDLKVAKSVGEENLKAFCAAATAAGATVEMWGNTALSTLAYMAHARDGREDRLRFPDGEKTIFHELEKSSNPWVRNPSNAIEADHYSPVFAAMNLRDDTVRRIWNERWLDARNRLGLGGIFLDSSFNMSSDKFHWVYLPEADRNGATADQTHLLGDSRPAQEPQSAILSQYRAHLTLMAEMQKMGYVYCGEDIGIFGIHRAGGRLDNLLQSMPLWVECLPDFDPIQIRRLGSDPDDIFFRAFAYRVIWRLYWDPKMDRLTWLKDTENPVFLPTESQFSILRAYNAVQPYMDRRTILANESGVVYHGAGKTVLWVFTPAKITIQGGVVAVKDILSDRTIKTDLLEVSKPGVYLLDETRDLAIL